MSESKNRPNDAATMEEAEEKSIENNPLQELARIVDTTRLNRIHASNRLLETERFIQHINIYYSCVAAIVTILGLKYEDSSFGIASAIMTVVLGISIVYLNAQKYGNRAQQLQMNYLALHQLRFDVENAIRKNDLDSLAEFQSRYVKLLQTSENHTVHDYRKNLWYRDHKKKTKEGYSPKLTGIEKAEYYTMSIFRAFLKVVLWIIPIVYFGLVWLKII